MPYEPMTHVQVRMRIRGRGEQYIACPVSAAGGRSLHVQVPRGEGGLPWVPEGTQVELLQRDGLHMAVGRVRARSLRPVPSYAVELEEPLLRQVLFTPKEGRAILVTGGKGGTGKTFVSTGLAVLLAKQGARVALLDADLGTADVAVNLRLPKEPHLGHVLEGKKRIEDVLQRDVRPNLSVLPGATGRRFSDPSSWKLGAILTLVQTLRPQFDYVVVDSRAGIGNDVTTLFAGVDRVLFVTADEPAGLSDTLELLQAFGETGRSRTGALVVNRVRSYRSSVDRLLQFRTEVRQQTGSDVQLWGVLQEDPRVHALAVEGKLLLDEFPLAPTSVALRQLAARVQAL
ncbi:MAG: P-loop NTPase [Thermaerobacter sp.]|nr:P-loop NTPase [Thermaerobacter sp.]